MEPTSASPTNTHNTGGRATDYRATGTGRDVVAAVAVLVLLVLAVTLWVTGAVEPVLLLG